MSIIIGMFELKFIGSNNMKA